MLCSSLFIFAVFMFFTCPCLFVSVCLSLSNFESTVYFSFIYKHTVFLAPPDFFQPYLGLEELLQCLLLLGPLPPFLRRQRRRHHLLLQALQGQAAALLS